MDKAKALDLALGQLEKSFGKGSIMRLGEATKLNIQAIPTGCLALDVALGVGGVPRGRIVEIYGTESSGKTTVALHCAAEAQKAGGIAAIIDAEHAVDPVYAKAIGVDIDNLLISQPDTGEEALEIADALIRSGAVDLVIIDSVAALVPKAEIEGDMGDSHMGVQARLMSQALRKLGGSISKSNTTAIFINQLREKIGVMFGNPEVTPGGRALKFWASVRMEVRRGEPIKNGTDVMGSRTKVKIVKNKVARRSARASSTSCLARASAARAASWTWAWSRRSSPRPARSSPSATSASARAARTPRPTFARTPLSPRPSRTGSAPPWTAARPRPWTKSSAPPKRKPSSRDSPPIEAGGRTGAQPLLDVITSRRDCAPVLLTPAIGGPVFA